MAVATATTKKKKKNWYPVHAPKVLREALLGETNVYSKEDIKGKKLSLNLATFTNDMRKQNIDVSFQVTTVVDNKAVTEITGISLTNAYVKRLVRRGRTKVEDSFTAKSKDGKNFRLKPVIITNSKTSKSVTSRIRLEMRKILRKLIKANNSEEFFGKLINQQVQKDIKDVLSKIYPLRYVDVRVAKFEKEKSGAKEEEVPDEELEETAASDEELKEEAKEEEKAEDK